MYKGYIDSVATGKCGDISALLFILTTDWDLYFS